MKRTAIGSAGDWAVPACILHRYLVLGLARKIGQGFDWLWIFANEWNNRVYCRARKMSQAIKNSARARRTAACSGAICRLALLTLMLAPMAAAESGLPLRIQSALGHRSIPDGSLSVYVQSLTTGDALLEWNESVARNPASVVKLLTTLVALDTLGPAYKWKTEIYALGDVDDGELNGDLLIKGYGDPFLVTEQMWQMLRQLKMAGIRRINGDLLLIKSRRKQRKLQFIVK